MLANVLAVEFVFRPMEQRSGDVEDRAAELRMAKREVVDAFRPSEVDPERLVRVTILQLSRKCGGFRPVEVRSGLVPCELAVSEQQEERFWSPLLEPPSDFLLHPRR